MTMPLSEFDKLATLRPDGSIRVTGTLEPERDDQGNDVPWVVPVNFHFMIVKDGLMATGRSQSATGIWGTLTPPLPGLTPGPAQAVGIAILARQGPPLAFETFTWVEEIQLEPGT
jgi:hypothetical protein